MFIEEKHLRIINAILAKYPYTFYAFGSRVKGTSKKFSDLDLCFIEKIPDSEQNRLEADFEESDLPYKVDLLDWYQCDEAFQHLIYPDLRLFQLGENEEKLSIIPIKNGIYK